MSIETLVGKKLYSLGTSGPAVEAIQRALRLNGYALKGTGYFGPATDTAIEAFQKRAGLKVDGVVGAETARALDAIGSSPDIPAPPAEISRPLWLEAGIKLIGTKEFAGGKDNPVILAWADEVGGNVDKAYTHDAIPWCKLFWELCLSRVGLKGNNTLWALDSAKWGVRLAGPAVGATMPMLRNGGGHIAFVVGKDQYGNLMCLGGNQSDAVNIKPFAPSRLYAPGGYRWPEGVPLPSRIGYEKLPVVKSDGRVSNAEA